MYLPSFVDELSKIADIAPPSPSKPPPMRAIAKPPALPRPGGMATRAVANPMEQALFSGMKGAANPFVGILKNAAPTPSSGILPKATAAAKLIGAKAFPRPSAVPSISNINPWEVKHMASTATPASMTAATMPPPGRAHEMAMMQTHAAPLSTKFAHSIKKYAAELNAQTRAAIPKKEFAVPAKKSNTGKEAYPIPDRQHARSALGFAKMHGDTADYDRVVVKVRKLYPDMIKEKAAGVAGAFGKALGQGSALGEHLVRHGPKYDLAGLGILAAPSVDNLAHQAKNKVQGKDVDKREVAHSGLELAGLGTLAAPVLTHAVRGIH